MRVFLDSNIIFSGLYSPLGAPGVILKRFVDGEFKVVISEQVLEELTRNVLRAIPWMLPKLKDLLMGFPPEIVSDPEPGEIAGWTEMVHPEDAAILAASMTAKPDYFVTGDRHFLMNRETIAKSELNVVAPAEFLAILDKR